MTPSSFEPSLDYVVVKIPRWAFEKFEKQEDKLGTQMRGVGEVMNIACGKAYSLLDLLERLSAMLDVSIEPLFEAPRAGDVRHSLASIDKAREQIGYEVGVDFDEGLRRTIEHCQSLKE